MADAAAPVEAQIANLHLDEVTGEKVSKSELKKRQKQRQKDEEKKKRDEEKKKNAPIIADLRKASAETLDGWLAEAVSSPLRGFARSLAKDRAAVQAAIDLPWSTSPVEGQINRLKLMKRAMYGRGGFHLLRQRMLLAA